MSKLALEDQVAVLVTSMGLNAVDLYDGLPFADASERENLGKALDYLEQHFVGEENTIYESSGWRFNTRSQEEGEEFKLGLQRSIH